MIIGDLNARVGKISISNVIETEGKRKFNNNMHRLRELAAHN